MGIFSFTISLADSSVSAVVLSSDDTAELLSCCDTAEGVFSAAQAVNRAAVTAKAMSAIFFFIVSSVSVENVVFADFVISTHKT